MPRKDRRKDHWIQKTVIISVKPPQSDLNSLCPIPSTDVLSMLGAECKAKCFMCAMPMTRIARREGVPSSGPRWYHDGHYPCLTQDTWQRFEDAWPGYTAAGQELNYGPNTY